jgi:adenosine deaminase
MTDANPTTLSGTSTLTREEIATWPKAELHCHLDGSPRLATVLDEARKQGKTSILPADSLSGLDEILKQVDDSPTLEAYLAWFQYTIPLMQSKESLRRFAYELAEDHAKDGVRYLEVRYSPILHREEGMSLEAVNYAVLDGLKAAERDHGIRTAIIVCGLRDRFESASMRLAELAAAYRGRGVVGFDLAGGEAGNPAEPHTHAFQYAQKNMVGITCHAGESWGPDSIKQALFKCGAHRIGHGITLQQNPDLEQYVRDHRIPLEICPTSNVQTHVVSGFESHPISGYVERGVAVTVNTDNTLFSRTSVTEELWRVHTRCGVPAGDLREIAVNGFRYAFLPWDEKQQFVRDAEAAILG